jgi:hypothetical protein
MNNRIFSLTAALVLALSSFAASIETDRSWYLAGEAMRVSVTVDDAVIAYAELCDTHRLAAGILIGLKENKGTGTIELPADLHSGYYVLSVYTRDNANVIQRLVAIVNPLRKSGDDDIEWVVDDGLSFGETQAPVAMTAQKAVDIRETEGHIIKARVRNVGNFKTNQITPSLSVIGKQIHYFEGKMVNDTTAVFYTYGVNGRQSIVISALSSTGTSLPIEMMSPFATLLPKQLPHLVFHYNRREVEDRSLDMQRHQMVRYQEPVVSRYDETAYGTKPDLSYNLDEYRQFLSIREVLLEYVNWVKNTKVNGRAQLVVRSPEASFDSSLPTLVLIDGMPVINTERLLSYDARRIHYINIYGGQYTFGNGVYNGILSFVTRSGRLTNYPVEPNMQYLDYDFPLTSDSRQ